MMAETLGNSEEYDERIQMLSGAMSELNEREKASRSCARRLKDAERSKSWPNTTSAPRAHPPDRGSRLRKVQEAVQHAARKRPVPASSET